MPIETGAQSPDRYADLKAFIVEWHHPVKLGDGNNETEIAETEARLGFRLPEALRELYALIGKREDITGRHNRLVLLDDLELEDGWLVVWEENQCVSLMAVSEKDLRVDDPIVYMMFDSVADGNEIHECAKLSDYALEMVAYETVIAGEWIAVGTVSEATEGETDAISLLRQKAMPTPYPALNGSDFFYVDDVLLYAPENAEVWIAVRNRDALVAAVERYNKIDWSYTSLDDE